MTTGQSIITIACVVLGTMATRFLPFLIFPEGKTSKGEMNEFQPGFAVLAEKTGARVVECAHIGEYHVFFGERKRIMIGDSYALECPRELRKSLYAK